MWSAFTILGSALGRKCYLDRGRYILYPNLFTILVAGSALCRKSTAISLGVELLEGISTTTVIQGKITPEKLTKDIAELQTTDLQTKEVVGPNVLVYSSELSVFLTKQSYGEPIIHVLTDLFDCPSKREYRTKNRGSDTLFNVFIAILAATTPDGVAKGVPESALQEGFASRIMFVYESGTDRSNPFPELNFDEIELQAKCKKMLVERSKMAGQFHLTPEARDWFEAWYKNVHKKSLPKDRRLEGMFGRKHDHVLRIGMILAGSFLDYDILSSDLEAALMAVERVEDTAVGAFMEIGTSIVSQHFNRLIGYMKAYKRMHYSNLLKKMYPCTATECKELIETALQSGRMMRDPESPIIYVYVEDLS